MKGNEVGCQRYDGLLIVHSAEQTCEVCRPSTAEPNSSHASLIEELTRTRQQKDALLDALRSFCGDYESTDFEDRTLRTAYQYALSVIALVSSHA